MARSLTNQHPSKGTSRYGSGAENGVGFGIGAVKSASRDIAVTAHLCLHVFSPQQDSLPQLHRVPHSFVHTCIRVMYWMQR